MDTLPNEILIKILINLPTYDLIQFCEAFEKYDYFLRERNVIQFMDFGKNFILQNFELCKFISTKVSFDYVTVLNINCIYWIPAEDLRNSFKKLKNLESLFAIDTKLGLDRLDCRAYSSLKLHKIALTVNPEHLTYCENPLPYINSLLLKYVTRQKDFLNLYGFLLKLNRLEEMWIVSTAEISGLDFFRIAHIVPNITKYVIKCKGAIPILDLKHIGLQKTFERRVVNYNEIIFEKIPYTSNDIKLDILCDKEILANPWNIMNELHTETLFGVNDSKKIHWKKTNVYNTFFEELNFRHLSFLCNERYNIAAKQILSESTAKYIKRLAINLCFFKNSQHVTNVSQPKIGFKKRRTGIQLIDSDNHHFQQIATKLNYLEEFEVWLCTKYPQDIGTFIGFSCINNFKKLKKLTIEIPPAVDGSFLNSVLIKCERLESLRITSNVQNEKLNINVCKNLRNAVNLKDFRFETSHLQIDNLFASLNEIENCKLERLFLKCNYVEKFMVGPFRRFLERNPQLLFLFIVIKNCSKNVLREVERTLCLFKKRNHGKAFYARKSVDDFTGAFPVPLAHHDMIFCHSNVSVIDVYRDFK